MARFGLYTLLACTATFASVQAGAHTVINHGAALRIMPLGASQTAGTGSTGMNGWRALVQYYLQANGNEVDYVGTQTFGSIPAPNNECEAYPGATIGQIDAKVRADGAYTTYKPNVIILTAGTNNCLQGPSSNGPTYDALHQMGALLEYIHETLPSTLTLVAGVIPWKGDTNDNSCIRGVNSGIQTAVSNQAAYGQLVEYVSLFNVLDPNTDYSGDGIHPNDAGYKKLAATWESAVVQYGGLITAAE